MAQVKKGGIPLPKEHGGWGMFIPALVLGGILAGTINVPLLMFYGAALAFYIFREPLFLLQKTSDPQRKKELVWWSIFFALIGIIFTIGLLYAFERWILLWIGILTSIVLLWDNQLRKNRRERSVFGEVLGIIQISLAAPTSYYAALGALGDVSVAFYTWILLVLFYLTSIPYVKLKVQQQIHKPKTFAEKARLGRNSLLVQVLALGVAITLFFLGLVPLAGILALLPNAIKAWIGVFNVPSRVNLKKVGFTELYMSSAFALILGLGYWLL